MTEQAKCTSCGSSLSSSVRGDLCPACLLQRGLETNTAGFTDDAQARPRWTPPTIEQLAPLFPELDILELIGRGGMGAVYKAREKQLDRLVALKILPPEIGREGAFAQRFAREAQAMARLAHPNIVTIYSFGQRGAGGPTAAGEDLYFLIMEYVDGLSLRQLLDAGTTCHKEALAIVPQICDALQYAHDRGIVHRDIKPENILLSRAGQVKIADFGLAKLVGQQACGDDEPGSRPRSEAKPLAVSDADPLVTQAGEKVMGTPRYMAPEQIEHPRDVDHRADIYSLGVVFYQMLTGELPKGPGQFEPPSRKVQIDVRLDEIVLRALEREPARRYQQVSQVKTQVETINAFPAATEERPPRRPRTLRWIAAIGILVVIGLACWRPWRPPPPPPGMLFSPPPADPQQAAVWRGIKLAGVLPDGGDDILDANGAHIGTGLAPGLSRWDADSQARTLIFDFPQTPAILWPNFPEVAVSQTGRSLGGTISGSAWRFQGKQRWILTLAIPRTYRQSALFGLRNWAEPIDRIDVTLNYYLPPRGKAACTFIGPFTARQAVQCQEGLAATLTPTGSRWADSHDTRLHLSATKTPIASDDFRRALAYDAQGKQYLLGQGGSHTTTSGGLTSADMDYTIDNLSLSQIAAITVGEEPQKKTFRNVPVTYPDMPARDHARYLDEMAAVLGLTKLSAEELGKYDFKTTEDVLKVIDIVRKGHIVRAWQKIQNADLAALPQDTRDKIRRAARMWADNGYFEGVRLGLKVQSPAFVPEALDVLGKDSRFRSEAAYSLQGYQQFTPQELERIAVILEQRDDPRGMYSLLECLNLNKRRPGGQEALLRVARSNKVWLWWPCLQYLGGSEGLTLGQLPRDLQGKRLAQTNPDLGLDATLAAESRTLLARLPTAKLAILSTSMLSEVMKSVARNLPRAEAQAVFLDLLQDMADHWGDYIFSGCSPSKWWAIDQAVRYLNNWNNLNLGGVGQDVSNETRGRDGTDWPKLAREVLDHFGRRPATAPATQPQTSAGEKTTPRTTSVLVDAFRQPIPDATLSLQAAPQHYSTLWPRPFQDGPRITVRTDSKGRFQIAWPTRTGERQVCSFTGQVSHPDYGAAPVTVYIGTEVIRALLVRDDSPEHQSALKGQVVNEAGQPVPGALVESTRAVKPGTGGHGCAIANSTGRFVMFFSTSPDKDTNRPMPPDAEYEVVARAPAGTDLFPVRMNGHSPMRLVLRTPTLKPRRLQFDVGLERYAQAEELDCIRLTWMPPDTRDGAIDLEARYTSVEPVRLMAGRYFAGYHDGHGRSFEYVPVDIDESSPGEVTFLRPPAATYRGQVVDGITGEPLAGAFVWGGAGGTNLAMLFERDWQELEAMPEKPSPDDPAIKPLSRRFAVESIMRTDAKGRYQFTRGREQRAGNLLVFTKSRLPMTVRLAKPQTDGQPVDVPAIPLFPAAFVDLRPKVPVGASVTVFSRCEYQPEGQPPWFQQFRQATKDTDFPGLLDTSGPVRMFVPARVNLKVRFRAYPSSSVVPKAIEQVLNLAPGETKDLGVLEFVPRSSPEPTTRPTSAPGQ